MKWIKVGGKVEPRFEEKILLLHKGGNWEAGKMEQIMQTASGKEFIFANLQGLIMDDITHFMRIEIPKEESQ